MAKKKTPIMVTITEGRHATQPWTFSIDDVGPGPKVTVRERYTRMSSCKVGALRKLRATKGILIAGIYMHTSRWFVKDREVLFTVKATKKAKA